MSVIGLSCLILAGDQLRPGIIRAASQPAYKNSDFSQIKVLLEWCDADSEGGGEREWADLMNSDKFPSVYLEQDLLWARRILASEQQRAVAWPARAFTQLCGSLPYSPETVLVEYFCDKEKIQLYINETKELVISEAKIALTQHPQMLQELNEWEERQRIRELLTSGSYSLSGHRVSVCNVLQSQTWITGVTTAHNTQTRELTVVEDRTQATHVVNPLMVHVVLQGSESGEAGLGGGRQRRMSLQHTSGQQQPLQDNISDHQQMWSHSHTPSQLPLTHTTSPPHNGSLHNLNSPSPIVQDCQSPHFNLNSSGEGGGVYGGNYCAQSVDPNRRSSLQHTNISLMKSEPNIHRRSSLDLFALQRFASTGNSFDLLHGSTPSLNQLPAMSMQVQSPPLLPPHSSPHGSSLQLSNQGSNSSLNDLAGHGFALPESYVQQEKSKSLDNLYVDAFGRPLPQHQPQKRRRSFGFPSSSGVGKTVKRPRFEVLPTIPDPQENRTAMAPTKILSRSPSLPTVFQKLKKDKSTLKPSLPGTSEAPSETTHQEDDLDIIKQIIDKDQSLDGNTAHLRAGLRSQSLSHIPREFSNEIATSSLPTLHHAESLTLLQTNYSSAPDFSQLHCNPPSYEASTSLGRIIHPNLGALSQEPASLGDFLGNHQLENPPANFAPQNRRDSGFSTHSLPTPVFNAQNTPSGFEHQFDFSVRRESAQSSIYSDLDNRTPGIDYGQRDGLPSTTISEVSKSFHFPSSPTSDTPGIIPSSLSQDDSLSRLLAPNGGQSPTPITKVENLSVGSGRGGFQDQPFGGAGGNTGKESMKPVHIVPEAEILSPADKKEETDMDMIHELGEFAISREVNQHVAGEKEEEEDEEGQDGAQSLPLLQGDGTLDCIPPSGKMESKGKARTIPQPQKEKRGRGRPRLSEEEKTRRKELRELGLMKRSKRRTKEEVAQWRANRILTPAKRGRKPGSGKKNVVKAASGKPAFVNLDMSQYSIGTVLLQNGFCRAFPGVSKCLECSTCDNDLPIARYCRFLEFRKLHIVDNTQPLVDVEGFANYSDVQAQDLVPWTPLKAGYSGMDEQSALYVLQNVMKHFVSIVTEEAKTLPDEDVVPVWRRAVRGIRELCDTCATTLFNFHWVCRHCGFCVCPTCFQQACDMEDGAEAVSSMQAPWPACVCNGQPHRPSFLIIAQIIPANVLSDVVTQALKICKTHKIQTGIPRILHRLVNTLTCQEPQSRYQNESKKHKGDGGSRNKPQLQQLSSHLSEGSYLNPTFQPLEDMSSLELPHSCSNGNEEQLEATQIRAPHKWLCDNTLLCLLDPRHEDNITAFQERWKRGEPVLITDVHHQLNKDLWKPESFERDFGDELADLVDCRVSLVLLQLPCRTFWAGFENMSVRLRDPTTDEPRLLKLKDWPTGDDFSEKLPTRFADLMNVLPLPEYTRRDGRLNMTTSLPDFFVKPDLGPKMYNAYGSPSYPNSGTTNLHLDISDAVNVMVYSSIPPSVEKEERRLLEETVAQECCPETVWRVKETGAQVGALWHIYSASDADKVRALLRKVFEERGLCQPVGTDPIHDQLVYLDAELRQRLYNEYGVRGWAIAQCVGDAIFIPAGAPHQVRNLCSCVKVAEDFVSPEHVYECLKLTGEFRQLSDRHANHEDKLQVKNIIYHSLKDIVGILRSSVK